MTPQGGQILGVFNTCADDLGELTEKVSARGRELVARDEPPVVTEPLLDAIVVEDGEDDGCLADSASTNESD